LILNAGLGVGVYNETNDGIDSHMQVNVFSQHHLMMTLLPILVDTPGSRVVMQSSELHRIGINEVQFQDLAEMNQDIGPSKLYARSKLAQVCLKLALHRRQSKSEINLSPNKPPGFIATHPGAVVTDQQEQAIEAYGTLGKVGVRAVQPFMKDPVDEGCRPVLFAAASEDVVKDGLDGVYLVPDRKVTDVTSHAKDEGLQEQCLRLMEMVLAEKFGKLEYPTSYA
jgi:WW domain-containing oxidoreductase